MQSVIIGKNQAGQRMDKFLQKYLPNAGTGFLYKMLRKKNITLNGKKAEGKELLNQGDEIRFFFSDETFAAFSGQDGAEVASSCAGSKTQGLIADYKKAYQQLKGIEILLETEDVLILNKPAGILTQKAKPGDLSLNEWLIGYLLEKQKLTAEELHTFHPSVCNRLDRNTSGIVLCGKSLKGSQALSFLIKERLIGKFYRTICLGRVDTAQTLEGYLNKNEKTNKVTLHKTASDKSDSYICTRYVPITTGKLYTLLEVELITGKTHQIRAHLASIGHPLIGDYKYGNCTTNDKWKKCSGLEYQLLHAYRVEFPASCPQLPDLAGQTVVADYPVLFKQILTTVEKET